MGTREASQAYPAARPRRRLRRWLATLGVLVVVLGVAGYGVVSFLVYDGIGKAPGGCHDADSANTPDGFTVPAEFDPSIATANLMPAPRGVTFRSRDPQIADAKLAGWWIPAEDASAPAVILVHGVQSCRREANVLVPAGMLYRHGYSVFLMDMRDHGDSEGDDHRFAGGSEEYLDVLGAWDWVRAQGVQAERIGLFGVSFGSANVLIAGGQEPLVAAVWADSSYTYTERAIGLFLKDRTGLPDILVPGAVLWGRLIAGDNLTAFNPIDELALYGDRAVAFVHGADDRVLPASMASENRAAAIAAGATSPDPWVVAGAGHSHAVYVDPAGYESRLVSFFDGAIGG